MTAVVSIKKHQDLSTELFGTIDEVSADWSNEILVLSGYVFFSYKPKMSKGAWFNREMC